MGYAWVMSVDLGIVADRYRLERVLGRGRMGSVWQARDETLGRVVAVKEVRFPSELSDHEQVVLSERMIREARLTALLEHPGVVTLYDVICAGQRCYLVMELVNGRSLSDTIDASGPLPVRQVATIGLALLDVLAASHRAAFVPRDIKPSNVLLTDDGHVVLSDFGAVTSENGTRLTSGGLLLGSATYLSPETLRGEASGPPADIWALGATLYAALQAVPPFRAATPTATIAAVLVDAVPPPRVHGPLREALFGMLDKDPRHRLTAAQVQPLLEQACVAIPATSDRVWVSQILPPDAPVMATVAGPQRRTTDASGRRRRSYAKPLVAAVVLLGLIAVAVGGVLLLFDGNNDKSGRRERARSAGTNTSAAVPVPEPFQSQVLFDFGRGLVEPGDCRTPESGELPVLERNSDLEAVVCETPNFEVKLFRKATSDELRAERRLYARNALVGSVQPIAAEPTGRASLFDGRDFTFTAPDGAARVYWDSESCPCGGVIVGTDGDIGPVRSFWRGR